MKTLTHHDFDELVGTVGTPCISIYMPAHQYGAENQADIPELQHLLRQVQVSLREQGMDDVKAGQLLDPLMKLLRNESSWHGTNKGVAIFIAPGFFRHFESPQSFPSLAVVGEQFHLLPLLSLIENDGTYYVLFLGKEDIRLFEGTRQTFRVIPVQGIAPTLGEFQQYTHAERELQLHSGMRPPKVNMGGRRGAIFHGGGNAHDREKLELSEFFRSVDKEVRKKIGGDSAPLILGGVGYQTAIFRQVTGYRNILDGEVKGSAASISIQQLQEESWRIAEPYFMAASMNAVQKYHRLIGTGLASMDPDEVMVAAHNGRIESLFIPSGDFGEEANSSGSGISSEQANRTVIETLATGGIVFNIAPDSLNSNTPLAAVFRY
jgi:hypothetical protein